MFLEIQISLENNMRKTAYIVALCTGGTQGEEGGLKYSNYQLIFASSDEEAILSYNQKNHCEYYKGSVMASKRAYGSVKVHNEMILFKYCEELRKIPNNDLRFQDDKQIVYYLISADIKQVIEKYVYKYDRLNAPTLTFKEECLDAINDEADAFAQKFMHRPAILTEEQFQTLKKTMETL